MPLTAEQIQKRASERAAYGDLERLVRFRPLDQPVGSSSEPSPFKSRWSQTVKLLARELDMVRAEQTVMMLDLRESDFRADGLPRADRSARTPGVVLVFESVRVGGAMRYVGAKFDHWHDNVRAIALSLEAQRLMARYGTSPKNEQYRGWLALPMGSGVSGSRGVELVREHGSIRKALHATAPDHGGDRDDYESVLAARKMGMV